MSGSMVHENSALQIGFSTSYSAANIGGAMTFDGTQAIILFPVAGGNYTTRSNYIRFSAVMQNNMNYTVPDTYGTMGFFYYGPSGARITQTQVNIYGIRF